MHPLGKISPQKPQNDEVPFVKAYSALPIAFTFFGFNFFQGSAHKWPKRIVFCLLKLIAVALMLANAYALYEKSNKKVRNAYKKVILKFNVRTELSDLLFAIFTFLALLVHEKSLAEFFTRAIFRKSATCLRVLLGILTAVWIIFVIAMPIAAIVGKSFAELSVAMMMKKFRAIPLHFLQIPLHILSTFFCGLYAFVCLTLLHQMSHLPRISRSLNELENHYRAIRLSVNVLENVFSGILPLLYVVRLGSFVIWLDFMQDEPGVTNEIQARRIYLALHLIQVLILILPPIFVNGMLESALDIEIKEEHQEKLFPGVYTASMYKSDVSVSPRVQLWTIQMASNSTRLTAGGVIISTWLIVKAVVCYFLVIWINDSFKLLFTEVQKQVPK